MFVCVSALEYMLEYASLYTNRYSVSPKPVATHRSIGGRFDIRGDTGGFKGFM